MNEFAPDLPIRLREALSAAEFSYDRVAEALGAEGHAALGRNETTPGLRAIQGPGAGGTPLETLTRLFLLQAEVSLAQAEAALPGLVGELQEVGFLSHEADHEGDRVRALLDIRPYATDEDHFWVVSDLTPGLDGQPNKVSGDHVLGISPAAVNLAQQTLRHPIQRALDLGTGCGVQALHLAKHASTVVATDVNERALWMTRFNAALNAFDNIEVRSGSLFEPVAGERFDLIATNPPFVISPATHNTAETVRLVYRDSGFPGDEVVERIVRGADDHLVEGGWLQILANWAILGDQAWDTRLGSWLAPEDDALVIQREILDPPSYVELWLKDAGRHGDPDYLAAYDEWLGWLEDQGVTGVGFGWINARRGSATTAGQQDFLQWHYDVESPIAPAIDEWADAVDFLAPLTQADLLDERLVARADVRQETHGQPGAEDPETIVLRQQRGFRRATQADSLTAALFGACDGDLTVAQIIDALAEITEQPADGVREQLLPRVEELIREGFLSIPQE